MKISSSQLLYYYDLHDSGNLQPDVSISNLCHHSTL